LRNRGRGIGIFGIGVGVVHFSILSVKSRMD
jgi:hypothetical protein